MAHDLIFHGERWARVDGDFRALRAKRGFYAELQIEVVHVDGLRVLSAFERVGYPLNWRERQMLGSAARTWLRMSAYADTGDTLMFTMN